MIGRPPNTKLKQQILEKLEYHKMAFSTAKIAEILGISWNTAEKYCEELNAEGKIKKEKRGKNSYWLVEK